MTALIAGQAPRPKLSKIALPLAFEANQGQTSARAQFLARSSGSVVFLASGSAVIKTERGAIGLRFEGANASPQAQGLSPLPQGVHYFQGAKSFSTEAYSGVRYTAIYPGIDVRYYGNSSSLEYDLDLAPGASAAQIQVAVAGGAPRLAADGSLQLAPGVRLRAPRAYQQVDGTRREIPVRYALSKQHRASFALGAYDHSRALTIDPVLAFASLLGGTAFNSANAVAVDASGSAYVAGATLSSDFPTLGPIQANLAAGSFGPANDAFVAKLSPDGTKLVYATYLGGSGDDGATGIAVDSTGAAYVAGFTSSTNFPTAAPIQASLKGTYNAFIAKINPAGGALVYSTYLGGSGSDKAAGVALDGANDAFIVGTTNSADYPTTAGAPQTVFGGATDAFVSEINAAGTALVASTYLGGSGADNGKGVAVDPTGNAYIVGSTISSNFPVTSGALQGSIGGGGKFDGFLAKLDRSGRSVDYATYIGGSGTDEVNAVAVDAAGEAFIAGDTNSINIFPAASSAVQPNFAGGSSDGFVAEVNAAGNTYIYATYLGGSQTDIATGIALDSTNGAYVVGSTSSTADFPTTTSAAQPSTGGQQDAFLTKLDGVGQTRLYSTYYGGSANDAATGVALNASGNLYMVGNTLSGNFPVTTGAFQTTNASPSGVAFVAEFVTAPQGVFTPSAVGFAAQAPTVASTAFPVTFSNGGEKNLTITKVAVTGPYSETDNCSGNSSTLIPGQSCTISVVFTPTAVGAQNGSLVVTDNAPGGSQTLALSGSGGDFSLTVTPTFNQISAGASASFGLNVTPATGYTQVVTLTCAGIGSQQNATCTPSPTSLTMNGSTTSTATYTINTTVRPALVPPAPAIPGGPWTWLAVLGLALGGLFLIARMGTGTRRRGMGWLGTAAILGWALGTLACGGSTTNSGTPPGNYNLTFTATAGSTNHTETVTLTVN